MLKKLCLLVVIMMIVAINPNAAAGLGLLAFASPTINVTTTNLAANATAFPLQGNQYEYLPFDAQLEFAIVANAATVDVTVYSGSDVLQQGGQPTVKTTIGVVYPDDFLLADVARRGERINVVLRETGAVATTDILTVVRITPI